MMDSRSDKIKKLQIIFGAVVIFTLIFIFTLSLIFNSFNASIFFQVLASPLPLVLILTIIMIINIINKKKRLDIKKKRTRAILALGLFIAIFIFGMVLFFSGSFEASIVFEYLASPLSLVIVLELSVIILGFLSFFVSKKWKSITLISSIIITSSLISFYFYVPYIPVDMKPNHPDSDWDQGFVIHVLPTVSDNRIILKASFTKSLSNTRLKVNTSYYFGQKLDTEGYNWCFDAQNLSPNTTYQLTLEDGTGLKLCDSWPLTTFPAFNTSPSHLRILVFTGSGGNDACRTWYGTGQIPLSIRQKLLNKALSFNPDVLIGSGDQIYYDIRYGITSKIMGDSRRAVQYSGKFSPSIAILGTENEYVLKRAVGPQIAYLYGTACRSIPTLFILDDHDYFANDDAYETDSINPQLLMAWINPYISKCITFPPDLFMLELARTAQKLFLPEFLPDPNRPLDLPATGASDRLENVSECFGTLRYGNLVEGLLYDTRRFVTLTGENASFIPPKAEQWIIDRSKAEDTTYVINFSPISFGWSAGKWLSWYPDIKVKKNGETYLSTEASKYMWQKGWFKQHNRILNASYSMENSTPLFVCGDMHAQAAGKILRSGDLNLSSNPVTSILTGSLSVDKGGFPSGGIRGIKATPPTELQVEESLKSYEKAGFVILDITHTKITIQFYGWRYGQDSIELIDNLKPHYTLEIYHIK